ncbi:hypothetical protein [Lacipirellula sp.]|uniref:hypothetical protein n=1 Tax=Lacipirellula sp. TaxID=2691419 RepID=UPI003D0E0B9A
MLLSMRPKPTNLLSLGLASLVAIVAACARPALAADGFPYIAYVTQNDTYVRSGPGGDFYPTSQLKTGYAVEVYRHDGDGWCAIRPVEGSFSLAPAHQLRILDSRTAEIIAPHVPARVGTSLTDDRSAVQVNLEQREMVQLIEQPSPGQPWVKIAPPAGEFRWIAARRLAKSPPIEGAASSGNAAWRSTGDAANVQAAQYTETEAATGSNPFAHLDAALGNNGAASPLPANPAWHPNAVGASAPPASAAALAKSADTMNVVPGSPAAAQFPAAAPVAPGLIADNSQQAFATKQPRIRFEGISAPTGPFDSRVVEMQLRLSQIVVQPPTTWQLGGLREEAATLLAQGNSPELRDQLRDLLDRIATFENVQARYRNAGLTATPSALAAGSPLMPTTGAAAAQTTQGMTGQSSEVLARIRSDLGADSSITPTPGAAPAATELAATDAKYDAVGTLKPVVSKRAQAPRFALVDDHGDVVTFVTASPDVNLQSYVGKRIGVLGNRGFMPEYRRAHVTASRITPLEERMIR